MCPLISFIGTLHFRHVTHSQHHIELSEFKRQQRDYLEVREATTHSRCGTRSKRLRSVSQAGARIPQPRVQRFFRTHAPGYTPGRQAPFSGTLPSGHVASRQARRDAFARLQDLAGCGTRLFRRSARRALHRLDRNPGARGTDYWRMRWYPRKAKGQRRTPFSGTPQRVTLCQRSENQSQS